MLAKRIIPSILVRGKTAYKGQRFESSRSIGSALAVAQVHARRGVDELLILDISATAEGRGPDLDLIRELSSGLFIPLTVGGGVRSLQDVDQLLRAGADKVAICTGVFELPDLIGDAANRFGSQAIVASVDVGPDRRMMVRCGAAVPTYALDDVSPGWLKNPNAVGWCELVTDRGVGEILLQSVDRDGMLCGYDLDLIREVSAAVSIPVIASGGCGTYEHMLEAFKAGADACASGAMFAFTDATPRGAAQFLRRNDICVRL